MAGRKAVQAIGPSYVLTDRKTAVQRSINLRVRAVDGSGEPNQFILESVEGLETFVTMPDSIRGIYATDEGRMFVVAGSKLYTVDKFGAIVDRGTLASSNGFVCMENGISQLTIVDGPHGYVYNFSADTLTKITDPDFRGSKWVEELNGTFIFVPDDQPDQFYLSAIDDAAQYDALDFSSSDAQPDNIVTHRVKKQELYLFGARSTEVWIYDGAADFPLVRYNSTPIDIGCVGLRAAVTTSDSLFFIGQSINGDGDVFEMVGHQPKVISNQAVSQALRGSSEISSAAMWTYQFETAEFIGISAPGMTSTWVYNLATRQWHEQAQLVAGNWASWPVDQIAFFKSGHYASSGATLYRLDAEGVSIGANQMVYERTWPHLQSGNLEPLNYRSLEVSCTTGAGGFMTLELSNDGGDVWGAPLLRNLGAIGRRMERIRWHGLGSAIDRVFRLRWNGAGKTSIYSAQVDA